MMTETDGPLAGIDLEHGTVDTNGVSLHTVRAGPADGPLVVLLHGFPEFWYGWRRQIGPLAEAGYRVVVPDQRGYNRSDKPDGLAAFNIDVLVDDVIGVIETAGRDDATVIGHDWGAAVAWWLASTVPESVDRLVTMNVPHPVVFRRFLTRDPRQMLRSWYMFYFQLPRLPEWGFSRNDYSLGTRVLRATSRAGAFTDDDLDRYREAWSNPGAVTGMINWYRALFRTSTERSPAFPIEVPTRLIWGTDDTALREAMAEPSLDLCTDGRLTRIEDATHWVQHEAAERVNRVILDFLDE